MCAQVSDSAIMWNISMVLTQDEVSKRSYTIVHYPFRSITDPTRVLGINEKYEWLDQEPHPTVEEHVAKDSFVFHQLLKMQKCANVDILFKKSTYDNSKIETLYFFRL